jgi:SAM-dependent methyltransferase
VVTSTEGLASSSFDVVTLNAVWMCLSSEEECLRVLKEIHRLLKAGGHLIASVTHPCFRDRSFSTYRTDFDMRNYLKDGSPFQVRMEDGTNGVEINDTHWSLGAMSRQLKQSGFVDTGFLELGDGQDLAAGSPWLIITASIPTASGKPK